MPRQANGQYLPPANTTAITATTISSTAYNTLETDIGSELTNSLDRLGRSAMQAALPMGGNKITGAADPTVATDVATKNYTDTLVAAFFSTGDVKLTLKTVADSGWVMFDDGTIGSASSGSSNRANADTQNLFNLIFNNISDTYAPILTSGGGATTRAAQVSASAAWAANCRISLTKTLGRALGVAGTGSGLTARPLGANLGAEAVTLPQNALPNATLSVGASGAISVTSTANNVLTGSVLFSSFLFGGGGTGGTLLTQNTVGSAFLGSTGVASVTGATASMNGGVTQTATSLMQPISFLNAMVKL